MSSHGTSKAWTCILVVLSTLALGELITSRPVLADTLIVGTYDAGGRSEPFGGYPAGEYEQIYRSTAFTGVLTIDAISFATVSPSSSGAETFTVRLATTSASVSSPSPTFADNYGADLTTVFSGTLSLNPKTDGTFDFVIPTTPFSYDPSKGNLLLDVLMPSGIDVSANFEGTSDSVTSRVAYNGINPGGANGFVTQFTFTSASVPEPSSLMLLASAGAAMAAFLRRRRKTRDVALY